MQPFDVQNGKDATKATQKSHLVAQGELEHQDHLLDMQAFDFQNNKDSSKITQ